MVFQTSACIEPMYSELPFLERFQAAKDDGFSFVEFWSWTDKDLNAVKAAAERAGIGISGFNGPHRPGTEGKLSGLPPPVRGGGEKGGRLVRHHPLQRPGGRRGSHQPL